MGMPPFHHTACQFPRLFFCIALRDNCHPDGTEAVRRPALSRAAGANVDRLDQNRSIVVREARDKTGPGYRGGGDGRSMPGARSSDGPTNSARNFVRAREARDLTVPTGTVRRSPISGSDRPSK